MEAKSTNVKIYRYKNIETDFTPSHNTVYGWRQIFFTGGMASSLMFSFPTAHLSLDLSLAQLPAGFPHEPSFDWAHIFASMKNLEGGAIANPDEERQVGHYWLRQPALAPEHELTVAIEKSWSDIKALALAVKQGELHGAAGPFRNLLIIGIGGSALGPQFIFDALSQGKADALRPFFFDNTDPDGMDRILRDLDGELGSTLAVVISKSGGTPETRNGMLEAAARYEAAGLSFPRHAIAITGEGSKLDQTAKAEGWLARFPMWDWVGGRTSVTGPVGLVPMALLGFDWKGFLSGAAAMDALTRSEDPAKNPATLLAAAWYVCTEGKGAKDMVILPYKDRLSLFSKYLQQLVMESLGKEKDLAGKVVHQGISVYGNKGSTDQHAYVQQLREGVANFFATFVQVLRDQSGGSAAIDVEPGITSGDYLLGFMLGTRTALAEKGRASLTLTIEEVNAFSVGQLIALYERAVGFYATMVGINAYHQPGVEAGKKAAAVVLNLQAAAVDLLRQKAGESLSAREIAAAIGTASDEATVYKICEHLAANGRLQSNPERTIFTAAK
jgi:glucose-6-phosphate isomerase